MSRNSYEVGGVRIDALDRTLAAKTILDWCGADDPRYVVLTGAHGVVEMQGDEELRRINNQADMVTPDGMSVVVAGWLRGFREVRKVYAPTLMLDVFRLGLEGKVRHFFYGGGEGVAERLVGNITRELPEFQVAGVLSPPFRSLSKEEVEDHAGRINGSEAHIVWVGLGCPKQERWMSQFRPLLSSPVLIGVGAGFDFLAGEKPWAPEVIQNSGFEWLFRLLSEPTRLLPRYGRIVPRFLYLLSREILTDRRNRS
jgi:N-acetylglucosaminyldiphosphoundecaprenol N-acetyl-beta-D-mannosaminyltransferase